MAFRSCDPRFCILFTFRVAATIVLSSTAGAAEYVGSHLGEFAMAGVYGGRPYFKQKNTEEANSDVFLYSYCDLLDCDWKVGATLGGYKRPKNLKLSG